MFHHVTARWLKYSETRDNENIQNKQKKTGFLYIYSADFSRLRVNWKSADLKKKLS
jgi:hypothetical protein